MMPAALVPLFPIAVVAPAIVIAIVVAMLATVVLMLAIVVVIPVCRRRSVHAPGRFAIHHRWRRLVVVPVLPMDDDRSWRRGITRPSIHDSLVIDVLSTRGAPARDACDQNRRDSRANSSKPATCGNHGDLLFNAAPAPVRYPPPARV